MSGVEVTEQQPGTEPKEYPFLPQLVLSPTGIKKKEILAGQPGINMKTAFVHILLLIGLLTGSSLAFGQSVAISNQLLDICPGDTVYLTVDTLQNTTPVDHYDWFLNDELIASGPYRLKVTDTGRYTVMSYALTGCGSPRSNIVSVQWKQLVALNDEFYTDPDTRVEVMYRFNDIAACMPLSQTTTHRTSGPANGRLLSSGHDGSYIYQPDEGFAGTDSFYYYLTDSSGAKSNVAKVSIHVGQMTAGSSGKNATDIYPNPVTDFLYIKGEGDNILQITLIDDQGRRFYQIIPKLEVTAIDMRRYAAAVYFVQVVYKDHTSKYFKVLKPR